jgi:hypothetical protein
LIARAGAVAGLFKEDDEILYQSGRAVFKAEPANGNPPFIIQVTSKDGK